MTPLHVKISGWLVIVAVGSLVTLWAVVALAFWALGALMRAVFSPACGPAVAAGGCVWLALRGLR